MVSHRKSLSFLLATLGIVLLPAVAGASFCDPPNNPAIYSINSSNGRLFQVDYDDACVVQLNDDANEFKSPTDLAVIRDAAGTGIVVVDKDRVCIYRLGTDDARVCQTITKKVPRGTSLTVLRSAGTQADGDLIVAGSAPGDGKGHREALYRIEKDGSALGYENDAELIVSEVSCDGIQQIRAATFSAGAIQTNDVLVACEVPARVLRFENTTWTATTFTDDFDRDGPTGIAFAPDKTVLVAEASGLIRRFDVNGNGRSPDFSDAIAPGVVRLSAGLDDRVEGPTGKPINIVLASQLNGGIVHRLKTVSLHGELVGELEASVTASVSSPSGIDCTSCRSTPIGGGDTIAPTQGLLSTYPDVEGFGFANGNVFLIHESSVPTGNLSDLPALGLGDVEIPDYINAMPRGPGGSLGNWYILYQVSSSLEIAPETVQYHAFENELGFAGLDDCDLPFSGSPQAAYAPELDRMEPPIVEGNLFANVDLGCSPLALWRGFTRGSLYLIGFDERSPREMIQYKCDAARDALIDGYGPGQLGGYIAPRLLGAVTDELDLACKSVRRNELRQTLRSLEKTIRLMSDNTDLVDNEARNVTGEVVVRAKSILSTLCRGLADRTGTLPAQCTDLLP